MSTLGESEYYIIFIIAYEIWDYLTNIFMK